MNQGCYKTSLKNSKPSFVARRSSLVNRKKVILASLSRATSDERRETLFSSPSNGFTLIEMIGVLAVMAILGGIVAPQLIRQLDVAAQDTETTYLQNIADGVELYLRENRSWPANLTALSPDYVSIGSTQVAENQRGFPRYFFVHPDSSAYSNATGLAASDLPDARFLLISNVKADANPTINNSTQFDNWWDTDESTTPDLKIYRGHVGKLFHLVSISALGDGGSYRIDGTTTNSGGGRLTSHGNYHLVGTPVEFDESNNFSPGNHDFDFTLANDAGYQFDPDCTTGSQWAVLGTSCAT